jgi:hypothetical protein
MIMIRRRIGDRWLLFTQHDHALLARALAERVGNDRYVRPEPREAVLAGIGLHDAGWPLHDDEPTLNVRGEPLDVFEVPREIGLKVWRASAERAAEAGPYAGLLASIHVLNLSLYATGSAPITHEKWDVSDARARFSVNQFQHEQIELQDRLRRRLGLHTDRPLKQGLADGWTDPRERELAFHFRMLQAMDQLSLDICCTEVVAPQIQNWMPAPGARPVTLNVLRRGDHELSVDPWPFDAPQVEVSLPCRPLDARPLASERDFRGAYRAAAVEPFAVRLTAG